MMYDWFCVYDVSWMNSSNALIMMWIIIIIIIITVTRPITGQNLESRHWLLHC